MSPSSAAAIQQGLLDARWTVAQLWLGALAIGGDFSNRDLESIASGERVASSTEHDIIAAALNERLMALGGPRPVRYWCDL